VKTVEVVGVDGTRRGWLAIRRVGAAFAEARSFSEFRGTLQAFPDAAVIAVDIPKGLPERGRRRADEEARRVLGPRGISVFFVPPASVLQATTFGEATRIARDLGSSVSQQVYAFRGRIFEVDRLAADQRVVEAHPEVSFWALNGRVPFQYKKRSWNGLMMRLELLRRAGLDVPPSLDGVKHAAPDDVVDAAAAAWTALRVAGGHARSLPELPEGAQSRQRGVIWY